MLGDTRLLVGLRDADAAGVEDEDEDPDADALVGGIRQPSPRRGFVPSLDDTGAMPIAAASHVHA